MPLKVRHISSCTIKPGLALEDPALPKRCDLTPWDLVLLPAQYIQKGLLFYTPSPFPHPHLLHLLKQSLPQVLAHFFPLAGRFVTEHDSSSSSSSYIFIDCNAAGAEFIHAAADVLVSEILTPIDVPQIVKSFFTFDGAVNLDGHTIPLLAVQVTQLIDGVFIGCSFNHAVGDGLSFWHFFNVWSEITRRGSDPISHPPITQRWFCDPSLIRLPFSNPNDFIKRIAPPPLRERIFHFTSQSITRLKAKANEESKSNPNSNNKISSFQALCTLLWRSVTRARGLPPDQKTSCNFAIGNRLRLQPPLSPYYFGNCVQKVGPGATAGELLSHNLGWAAWLVHESVAGHTDAAVRGTLDGLVKQRFLNHVSGFDHCRLVIGSSPRFDMYGNDFGWGKPVAVRSGCGNQYDGKVNAYPGVEGGGSVDLEICLFPEFMKALEEDVEFMDAVSHPLQVL